MILAVAPNPGAFTEVEKWLQKLDIPAKVTVGSIDNYVYKLKYGRAEILGNVVNQLYGGCGISTSLWRTAGKFDLSGIRLRGRHDGAGSASLARLARPIMVTAQGQVLMETAQIPMETALLWWRLWRVSR